MLGLEDTERKRRADQHQHSAVIMKAVAVIDTCAFELQVVRRRTADQRDAGKGGLKRVHHRLLAYGQPVDHQESEHISHVRCW
jgi:hypothetical protein